MYIKLLEYNSGSGYLNPDTFKKILNENPDNEYEIDFNGIDLGIVDSLNILFKDYKEMILNDKITLIGLNTMTVARCKYLLELLKGNDDPDLYIKIQDEEFKSNKSKQEPNDLASANNEYPEIKKVDESLLDLHEKRIKEGKCPICNAKLIFQERCKTCSNQSCGWSACS